MSDNFREPEDLLSDESFLSWRISNDGERKGDWERWMMDNPERVALVEKAIVLLEATRMAEKQVDPARLQRAEAALMEKITAPSSSTPLSFSSLRRLRFTRIAAACLLIVLAGGSFLLYRRMHASPEINTGYGQIASNVLPDGTEVMMNANSHVKYSGKWAEGADREVWIDGEAFFHVRKTPEKSRFIVHTVHLDIIVTGTRFNVVCRHGQDNVMLQEGSVTLHTCDGNVVKMAPGDYFEYDCKHCSEKPVRKDSLLAWKDQRLFLDSTSLRQLSTIIYDHYGVPVKLDSDTLANKKISGIIPNNDLDVLLRALEATAEYDITRETGDTIVIRAHR